MVEPVAEHLAGDGIAEAAGNGDAPRGALARAGPAGGGALAENETIMNVEAHLLVVDGLPGMTTLRCRCQSYCLTCPQRPAPAKPCPLLRPVRLVVAQHVTDFLIAAHTRSEVLTLRLNRLVQARTQTIPARHRPCGALGLVQPNDGARVNPGVVR